MSQSLIVRSVPFSLVLRARLAIAPLLSSLVLLGACNPLQTAEPASQGRGLAVKFLVGSNLAEFCQEASTQFNNTNPTLENGEAFHITCEAKGSGDVVNEFLALAQQFQGGTIPAEAPEFPTLLSVDGEIYQNQLIYQMNQLFPGQNYIPAITDSPLIAYSPMVLMVPENLAAGLQKVANNPYTALAKYTNHQQLDPSAPALPITYVHTAPTRSNSGLQTLVAQFASVANKRPEDLSAADVQKYQDQVRAIQSKITRYGISTGSLAQSMAKNGPFWASVGSVYEASVIEANAQSQSGQTRYVAVYPQATFSSNIRGILPSGPWVSDSEKAAAKAFIDFMLQPETQQVAANLGLRPGVPGVALGSKFSPQFGVQSEPRYDSYRPPQPDVVAAMLASWQEYAKKSSLVAVVVDTSGSMEGEKLSAMQNTLFNYIQSLGPKEKIALIAFNSTINPPVIIEGTQQGRDRGLEFVKSLRAGGGTRLYDSTLFARNWLQQNLRPEAINAVLVLTDGEDSESQISLEQLAQELQKSGFSSDQRLAFFTVGYGREGEFDPQALEKIADLNAGYYRKGDPATISQVLADLQVEF